MRDCGKSAARYADYRVGWLVCVVAQRYSSRSNTLFRICTYLRTPNRDYVNSILIMRLLPVLATTIYAAKASKPTTLYSAAVLVASQTTWLTQIVVHHPALSRAEKWLKVCLLLERGYS
jgi:hypothetical protein